MKYVLTPPAGLEANRLTGQQADILTQSTGAKSWRRFRRRPAYNARLPKAHGKTYNVQCKSFDSRSYLWLID